MQPFAETVHDRPMLMATICNLNSGIRMGHIQVLSYSHNRAVEWPNWKNIWVVDQTMVLCFCNHWPEARLFNECVCSLCGDHNPITFEAYLGNIRNYNILRWHRSAIGAADFIGMVKYSSNIVKSQLWQPEETICDHMWSVTCRQVAYYSVTNS